MSRTSPSQVIADTIDASYPIAGEDNDSQGFRDNFNIIKDGLATAKAEITVLQINTARLDDGNNFGGNLIDNALTNRLYGTVYTTTQAGSINVALADGPYQEITVTGTATLIVGGWPEKDWYASIRLAIKSSTNVAHQVTLSAAGGSTKLFLNNLPETITVSDAAYIQIIDIWTINHGATVYFKLADNVYYSGSEDLANAGAAELTKSVSYFSTAAAETATLAAGVAGQIKTFAMYADTGDMVITVGNAGWKSSGTGTITFNTVGQACSLQYINSRWFCIGNNGAVFA